MSGEVEPVSIAKERDHDSRHELRQESVARFGAHMPSLPSLQHPESARNVPSSHVVKVDIVSQWALFSHLPSCDRKVGLGEHADQFADRRVAVFGFHEIRASP